MESETNWENRHGLKDWGSCEVRELVQQELEVGTEKDRNLELREGLLSSASEVEQVWVSHKVLGVAMVVCCCCRAEDYVVRDKVTRN